MIDANPPRKRGFGEPQNESQVRRAKTTNLVAVSGLLLMIGLTLYYMQGLSATKSELQRNKALLEVHADSLADMQDRQVKLISELNSFKDEMAKREQKAWRVVDSLAALIKGRDYSAAREIADGYDSTSRRGGKNGWNAPIVNLYFYKAPEPLQKSVKDYVHERNLKLLGVEEMEKMTKWLMDYSIVEYYDKAMAVEAERIAKELSAKTKTNFVPTHSPDLQLDAKLRWINVVVVGANASEAIRQTNAPYMQMRMDKGK